MVGETLAAGSDRDIDLRQGFAKTLTPKGSLAGNTPSQGQEIRPLQPLADIDELIARPAVVGRVLPIAPQHLLRCRI